MMPWPQARRAPRGTIQALRVTDEPDLATSPDRPIPGNVKVPETIGSQSNKRSDEITARQTCH